MIFRAAAYVRRGSWKRTTLNTRYHLAKMFLEGHDGVRSSAPRQADEYVKSKTVPLMLDPDGRPIKRNFVHVNDLVDSMILAMDHPKARQQTFNICMDEPVDYRQLANYLRETRGMPAVEIKTPYWSTWLDNSKAKFLLGWRPEFDLAKLVDEAWSYQRSQDDPRVIWYPG